MKSVSFYKSIIITMIFAQIRTRRRKGRERYRVTSDTFLLVLLLLLSNKCMHRVVAECVDSTKKFEVTKLGPKGWTKLKGCDWVRRRKTAYKCDYFVGVKEGCPKTCTNCCEDSTEVFTLLVNNKSKTCDWAMKSNTNQRCWKKPTRRVCGKTCGSCSPLTPRPTPSPVSTPPPTPAPVQGKLASYMEYKYWVLVNEAVPSS